MNTIYYSKRFELHKLATFLRFISILRELPTDLKSIYGNKKSHKIMALTNISRLLLATCDINIIIILILIIIITPGRSSAKCCYL